MPPSPPRISQLQNLYADYLQGQPVASFLNLVQQRYDQATLERIATMSNQYGRRAAVFVLVSLGDYSANPVVGLALADADRTVREIARQGIAQIWRTVGTVKQQRSLQKIIALNRQSRYAQAALDATEFLEQTTAYPEVWNQRSIAHHRLKLYTDAIRDGRRAVEGNPYHFECFIRMGRCQEQLEDPISALDYFRQALCIHPDLAGVRAKVHYLQRSLSD